jgi:hypothetical protein
MGVYPFNSNIVMQELHELQSIHNDKENEPELSTAFNYDKVPADSSELGVYNQEL